jgi:hypothetical protein
MQTISEMIVSGQTRRPLKADDNVSASQLFEISSGMMLGNLRYSVNRPRFHPLKEMGLRSGFSRNVAGMEFSK